MSKSKTKTIQKRIKTETLYRDFAVKREHIDEEKRTVQLAFSSDEPYRRWFGDEILDHGSKSIRLGRLKDGGPVLVDHDSRDHVGVVEVVEVDGSTGRAIVRFGRSARATEIFNDILDGIRSKVSVGYIVHKMVLEETGADDVEVYRVTDWEPLEVSMVSIPADATVGVGRSLERNHETEITTTEVVETKTETQEETIVEKKETAAPTAEERAAIAKEVRDQELTRVKEISAVGSMYPQLKDAAESFVRDGKSVEEFRAYALKEIHNAKELDVNNKPAELGMEEKEIKNYSMFKAIRAAANKNWKDAGLELEVSRAIEQMQGKEARGFYVPYDVLARDLVTTTDSAGGHLVGTDHMAGSFIEMLRNKAMLGNLGAHIMDGLVGNVDIPSQAGGATFYWINNETTDTTESALTFGNVVMSPKTVSGRIDMTRRLLQQSSPSVEALVRADLAAGAALAIDLAGINGAGTAEPVGILNTVGIGDVAGGTNGLAPTWAHMVDLESEVAIDNADIGALAYLTNTKVRGKLKKTEMFSGTNGLPVWERGENPLNGYRAAVTNQVPSDLDKGTSTGVCSAVIFGNFNDLLIGMWGGLDIKVDDVTLGDRGGLVVRVFQDVDVAVRHAQSFAAMQDALTA